MLELMAYLRGNGLKTFDRTASLKLMKLAKLEVIDHRPGKPVAINRFIGRRRPIFAFGMGNLY